MVSTLLDVLSEYSLASFLIILSLVSLYFIYYKPVFEKKRYSEDGGNKKASFTKKRADLLAHEFFRNIDLKIGVELPLSKYSDLPNRNELVKDMTVRLFSLYRDHMYEFCESISPDITAEKLSNDLTKLHFDVLRDFTEHGIAGGAPVEAVNSYKIWFMENINIIHHYTSNICKPNVDTHTTDRVWTFLFVLQIVLISALNDLQKKPPLNGSLNGVKYGDLTLEDDS